MWRSVMCSLWLFILKKFLCWENGVLHLSTISIFSSCDMVTNNTPSPFTYFSHFCCAKTSCIFSFHNPEFVTSGELINFPLWTSDTHLKNHSFASQRTNSNFYPFSISPMNKTLKDFHSPKVFTNIFQPNWTTQEKPHQRLSTPKIPPLIS